MVVVVVVVVVVVAFVVVVVEVVVGQLAKPGPEDGDIPSGQHPYAEAQLEFGWSCRTTKVHAM